MAVEHIKKRTDFLAAAKSGSKWVTPGIVIQMRERGEAGAFRAGFTVTRKIGKAVVRNRVRRRLRAVAREVLPGLAREGCDYVLIGRLSTMHRSYAQLTHDLKWALSRLHGGGHRSRGYG